MCAAQKTNFPHQLLLFVLLGIFEALQRHEPPVDAVQNPRIHHPFKQERDRFATRNFGLSHMYGSFIFF